MREMIYFGPDDKNQPPARTLPTSWDVLYRALNGLPGFEGMPGVRSPEYPCELFDGKGYDGVGDCYSDGHYLCVECSHLSPEAARFVEYGRDGRADRLRLYWFTMRLRRAGIL